MTIDTWLDHSSGPAICRLLGHTDQGVSHNLRAWLIRHMSEADLKPLLEMSGLAPEVIQDTLQGAAEHRRARDAGVASSRAGLYLFSYIPNLSECQRKA